MKKVEFSNQKHDSRSPTDRLNFCEKNIANYLTVCIIFAILILGKNICK